MLFHAGIEFVSKFPILSYFWRIRSNYITLLSVEGEPALMCLINRLEDERIRHVVFKEPDIGNQIASVCIEPSDRARALCAGMPLALKEFSSTGINKSNFTKLQVV